MLVNNDSGGSHERQHGSAHHHLATAHPSHRGCGVTHKIGLRMKNRGHAHVRYPRKKPKWLEERERSQVKLTEDEKAWLKMKEQEQQRRR